MNAAGSATIPEENVGAGDEPPRSNDNSINKVNIVENPMN